MARKKHEPIVLRTSQTMGSIIFEKKSDYDEEKLTMARRNGRILEESGIQISIRKNVFLSAAGYAEEGQMGYSFQYNM